MFRREPANECCYYPRRARGGWFALAGLIAVGLTAPLATRVLGELLAFQASSVAVFLTVAGAPAPITADVEPTPGCGAAAGVTAADDHGGTGRSSNHCTPPAGEPPPPTGRSDRPFGSVLGPVGNQVPKAPPRRETSEPQAGQAATGLGPDSPRAYRERPDQESPPSASDDRRVRVRDEEGRIRVARLYSAAKDGVVLLPDGRLAWTKGELAFTDEPFVPVTADALEAELEAGVYRGFQRHRTGHYLVFSRATEGFTRASANLLESLYEGLTEQLRAKGFAIRDAEFPLVAVIFRSEAEFRAHDPVPDDVQAYYNVVSNRIVFYESSPRDLAAPDVAALRRPQTVAHEGTHQILQNVGLQPRLAGWPLWLVEGLAEYFAPTTVGRDGRWDGANRVNPFHMATLRDLQDPLMLQIGNNGAGMPHLGRPPGTSTVEYLVTREQLSPTDYALSWALTYYLANKRFPKFLDYLQELSRRPPLERATPAQHLADFRRYFPDQLGKMDRAIDQYLAGLKGYEALKHYAITFEQPIGRGIVRRGVLVSQSPAMAKQWLDEMRAPDGGPVVWHAYPFPTRLRARLMAEQWLNRP